MRSTNLEGFTHRRNPMNSRGELDEERHLWAPRTQSVSLGQAINARQCGRRSLSVNQAQTDKWRADAGGWRVSYQMARTDRKKTRNKDGLNSFLNNKKEVTPADVKVIKRKMKFGNQRFDG